jgi:hypothetical protein
MGLLMIRLTCIGSVGGGGAYIYSILFNSILSSTQVSQKQWKSCRCSLKKGVFLCLITKKGKIPVRSLVSEIISVASTYFLTSAR